MILFELFGQAPVYFALICILSVLAVSISKSGFGGALGAISMPILIFVMPPKMAIGVLLPLFLITDVWVVYLWRQWVNWRFLFLMAGFGVTGQLLGWLLFDYLSDRVLTGVIGVVGILTALNYGRALIFPDGETGAETAARMMRRVWVRAPLFCGLSGLASFVSLTGGIAAQVFLLPHALARQAFVGTMSVYFFVINIVKLPFYAELDLIRPETLYLSAWLLPVIPVGVLLGRWLNRKMSDRIFYHVSHVVLFAMSAKLIYDVV